MIWFFSRLFKKFNRNESDTVSDISKVIEKNEELQSQLTAAKAHAQQLIVNNESYREDILAIYKEIERIKQWERNHFGCSACFHETLTLQGTECKKCSNYSNWRGKWEID